MNVQLLNIWFKISQFNKKDKTGFDPERSLTGICLNRFKPLKI